MWTDLPEEQRNEYKRMILAFASLTEIFAQKAENNDDEPVQVSPIINSKYQETVFQHSFNATPEDIGNTSYDASISYSDPSGRLMKYLIGIKTFGIASGAQKIAQFKRNLTEWSDIINNIRNNAVEEDGSYKSKATIDDLNHDLYLELAVRIATLRNARIASHKANLQGFTIQDDDTVESIYHVLMPSAKTEAPAIHVGEISYDPIDINNIAILGCTQRNNPTNFNFTDGNHSYRFTSADSQLLMEFNNRDIVVESWDVQFIDDVYSIFSNIADQVYGTNTSITAPPLINMHSKNEISESYSWLLTNQHDEVELFSGFNSFYGVGSKMGQDQRENTINVLENKYKDTVDSQQLKRLTAYLKHFLLQDAKHDAEKKEKVELRKTILSFTNNTFDSNELKQRVTKLLFRPQEEIYIPIPNSAAFHNSHPDFFCKELGAFSTTKRGYPAIDLNPDKTKREFNLVFEPSGNVIKSYIVESSGKAIQSVEKQSYLGEWILRGIFQLDEYEPLTTKRLNEIGINGIRLWKTPNSDDVHLNFIWIDKDNLPKDFVA